MQKNQIVSLSFDDDYRRKMVMKAFVFSDFRSQVLSVDYTSYDYRKYELVGATLKLFLDDLPQLIIQCEFLRNTRCGQINPNSCVYISIAASICSFYFNFLVKLLNFLYSCQSFKQLKNQTDLVITDQKI